jgi:hypothetical protein
MSAGFERRVDTAAIRLRRRETRGSEHTDSATNWAVPTNADCLHRRLAISREPCRNAGSRIDISGLRRRSALVAFAQSYGPPQKCSRTIGRTNVLAIRQIAVHDSQITRALLTGIPPMPEPETNLECPSRTRHIVPSPRASIDLPDVTDCVRLTAHRIFRSLPSTEKLIDRLSATRRVPLHPRCHPAKRSIAR